VDDFGGRPFHATSSADPVRRIGRRHRWRGAARQLEAIAARADDRLDELPLGSGALTGGGPQPVITVTPQPDGAVVHVVEEGQTLWTIAAVYGLDLAQLLSLNGMTEDSFVHPGDRVVIRAGSTATPTTLPSATPSPSPGPATVNPPTPTAAPLGSSLLAQVAAVNPRDLLAGGCVAAWVIIVIAGLVVAVRRP